MKPIDIRFNYHRIQSRQSKYAIDRETTNKIVIVTTATSWLVNDFLRSHTSKSYINLLIITQSARKKRNENAYLLYTHKLYLDGVGTSKAILLTSWINNSLTKPHVLLFPDKLQDGFKGHRILISTAHQPPFAIRKAIAGTDEIAWDGIDVRLIKLLGDILNFTADFRPPTSTTLSPIAAATNDIRMGLASIAIGGIYKTTNITSRFDTSFGHIEDCASFLSLASTALPKYRAVLGPFQITVWILLTCSYLLAIVPLTMNSEYSLLSLLTHPSRTSDMFWFVFSTFTNCFTVKNPLLNYGLGKNSTAILIGTAKRENRSNEYSIYWVFTIIVTSCYTSSIIAFITVPVYPTAMETVEQLLRYRYRIGTLDHDGWEKWFEDIDDPMAQKLLKNIECIPSVEDGVRNVSRAYFWPYAFLGSKTLLEYIVQANFTPSWITKRSLMHISHECFMKFGVTFVLPRKSVYTEAFSSVIYRAQQTGLVEKIVQDVKWDIQRTATGKLLQVTKGPTLRLTPVEERQLTLDDVQGMFLVFGAGLLIGFFVLLLECLVHSVFTYCCKKHTDESVATTIDWHVDPESIENLASTESDFRNLRHRKVRRSV
ncbi:ionotropic receptor 21a isoform X2 [Cephus cinctus]|uniref:Ionotropic receptor 21a isoform X2 n=1 Tax=Cephus cinctus TaxID=211228 RepID=A0AAJ7VXQ1_CEPCN|nr:ionotropic receptor 21a isoform X2 [Cephus cinctus]